MFFIQPLRFRFYFNKVLENLAVLINHEKRFINDEEGTVFMEEIYLDHAATTPIHEKVLTTMYQIMNDTFGNPSSIHSFGRKARSYLDQARRVMAESINANEKEIIFTSGGTEADNLALIGTAMANKDKGKHIITSAQEHHATLYAAKYLEKQGFKVTYLPVYPNGQISVDDLKKSLTNDTILVSIMTVNNETGIIQPIEEIGDLLKEHQAYFHTDAVQAFGQLAIDVKKLNIDLLSVSAHKINGPKGIGFLYAAEDVLINALQYGGEQERKRRPGTENVAGVVGMQAAVEIATASRHERIEENQRLKAVFLQTLREHDVNFMINGDEELAVSSIVNISFPGINVESMLTNLDLSGVAASSGSACTAGSVEPSHVLVAMYGEGNERTTNSIRFSFGLGLTPEMMVEAANRVSNIIKRLTN